MTVLAGEPRPKLCINCKHIGRNGSGDASKYRCMAPANIVGKHTDLVTGNTSNLYRRESCYDARLDYASDSCGQAGNWFEAAPPRIEPLPDKLTYRKHSAAADLLSQLDNMK